MDVSDLLDWKGLAGAAVGVAAHKLWSHLAGGVKELEYTVQHSRIADGQIDQRFPGIAVTWNGGKVANLWMVEVNLRNTTSTDLEDLRFRVYTGDSPLLLNEESHLLGTPQIVRYTAEFEAKIHLEEGQAPTPEQFKTYAHNREYAIPVFNRGQHAKLTFVTTRPPGIDPAGVWIHLERAGYTARHMPMVPRTFGAPIKKARVVGSVVVLAITAGLVWFKLPSAIVAPVALTVGLMVQPIGAYVWRVLDWGRKIARSQ